MMDALIGPALRRERRREQVIDWARGWYQAARSSGLPCGCEHDWIEMYALTMAEPERARGRRNPNASCPQHQWIDRASEE